jgi:RNA-directed DNA polymerase
VPLGGAAACAGEGRPRRRWGRDRRPARQAMTWISSGTEQALWQRPRRLADGLTPDGQRQVHAWVDKVYQPKHWRVAWEKVQANRGSGGIDGQSLEACAQGLDEPLGRLHEERRTDGYQPLPVRRVEIPQAGRPGETRPLGIPAVSARVCQQAWRNRLAPSFAPLVDDRSVGYRSGRSATAALRKVWRAIDAGAEGIGAAALKADCGTLDHEQLRTLVAERVADGRVLTRIERRLTAGYRPHGRVLPTPQGTPPGGVVSPWLSTMLLTPFAREMRRRGYQLTRSAADGVITCRRRREAEAARRCAEKLLATLGVRVNPQKTRMVPGRQGCACLGSQIKRGSHRLSRPAAQRKSGVRRGELYAYPTQTSVDRFKETIRRKTRRRIPRRTAALIRERNPVLRGWGEYDTRAHGRRRFNQLDRWVVRRRWSHHHKRWRCAGWRSFPTRRLRGELGLVSLISLLPALNPWPHAATS